MSTAETAEYALAQAWIARANDALGRADAAAFAACIAPEGWLRDILVFRPSMETRRGTALIQSYLSNTLANAGVGALTLDSNPFGAPKAAAFGLMPVVEAAFDFETPHAVGKGYVRVLRPKEREEGEEGEEKLRKEGPKALMVLLMVQDWKGYEEPGPEQGVYDGHKLSWGEVRARRRAEIERDPYVLVVGGAQTGLQVAARLQQHGFKTLLIEKTARIGDIWRNRYPTLTLHTMRAHHQFLYESWPSNWPTFTPRDKLADWMEQYAVTQDLVVWTSSTLEPTPIYNTSTKHWTVTVTRNGVPLILHPAHIVLSMGIFGDARMPELLPGSEKFPGSITHSSAFAGGAAYEGQRVLVVGAGNTAADVCQDLEARGAKEVTMVQRSSTAIISSRYLAATLGHVFNEETPIYYTDLAFTGVSYDALRELGKNLNNFQEDFDKELLDGLRKTSFKLKGGENFAGQLFMVFERGGGYSVDVGCGQLIIDGKVKVKQGVEIERLTPHGVVYSDGSTQDADGIIFATGWHPVKDRLRGIFGPETIDRMQDIWGGDEYGELRAGYKYSGVPGLYFATGDFAISRQYSKFLALYFKGLDLGYFPPHTT